MTETPQAPSESTAGKPSPRSSRLGQVAAVVGITAGVVFVVGAVFFRACSLAPAGSITADRR